MPPGNSPISQEIIVALQQTGSLDQVLEQLIRAKAEIEALNKAAQDGARADKALESSAYDVGAAYELVAEKIGRATTAAEKNTQAAPWAAKQQQALSDLIREMGAYEARSDAMTALEVRNYQVIASAATRTGAAIQSANQRTASSSQAAGRALLEISRGIEDLSTGGFLGILNNIPTTVQAIGQAMKLSAPQVAGLTAGVSLLATAAYEVYVNYDKLQGMFGLGIPRPILDSTEDLKDKLKAAKDVTEELGKKTVLTIGELKDYKDATARVKEFNAELERRRDLEAILSGKSKAERERASAFKEAVAESGGSVVVDSLDTAIGKHADDRGLVFNEYTGKNSKPRELAERMIGTAGEGDKRARDQIVELLNAAYKPTPGSFASNIVKLAPETVAEAKANPDVTGKFKDKDLEARIDLAEAHVRDKTKAYDEAARTDPNITGKFADRDLQAQVDLADRHAREKTQEYERAEREKTQAAGKQGVADRKEATAYRKKVNEVDDGYLVPLQQAITRNSMGQLQGDPAAVPDAVLRKRMEHQVAQNLRGAGQDPGLAKGVVQNAADQFNQKFTQMFAATGSREQALIGVNQHLLGVLAQEMAAGQRRDAQIGQLQAATNQLWQNAARNQMRMQPVAPLLP